MTRPRIKSFTYVAGKKYDGMMGRCYRPTDGSYNTYGGRGIRVCSEWIKDNQTFKDWLRLQLIKLKVNEIDFVTDSKKFTLDRIDVNGHYTPENCRLATPQLQSRNRRKSRMTVESAEGERIYI